MPVDVRRANASRAGSTSSSTSGSGSIRSRSATACGTGSTRAAGRRGTRTRSSTPTARARFRAGEASSTAHARWHLSSRRHVPAELLRRMRAECDALVFTNPQTQASTPFLAAARRLDLPGRSATSRAGTIRSERASCRRTSTPTSSRTRRCARTSALPRHRPAPRDRHRLAADGRVPPAAPARPRTRSSSAELGLPTDKPVVLYAGNSPHNMPYEPNLVARLVAWWRESGAHERFSLLFRPHPYDEEARERFRGGARRSGRRRAGTELDGSRGLATLLQHVDCVVANAGTIMLEALVNDRPAVCVTFDEGAPEGRTWAGPEPDRRALPQAPRVGRLLPRGRLRGARGRDRPRARESGRTRTTSAVESRTTSSARWTARAAERVVAGDRERAREQVRRRDGSRQVTVR